MSIPPNVKDADKIKVNKTCNCCKKFHEYLPKDLTVSNKGLYWWNCSCNSTLVSKVGKEII